MLRFDEVPRIRVRLIERPEEPPVGCGEAAHGQMAAALGNALRDALGARLDDLPLDRDAILRALARGRRASDGEGHRAGRSVG